MFEGWDESKGRELGKDAPETQSEKVLEGGGSFGLESCDDIVHSTCLSKQGQLALKHSRTTSARVRPSSK